MNQIKMLRKRSGLTQKDVAMCVGVSQVSVWRWEHGLSLPTASKLPTIAKMFGCTVDDLLRKEG